MGLAEIKTFIMENAYLFALVFILLIPTILHFSILNMGYTPPSFINKLAINSWMKATIGVATGIVLGIVINKKTG